MYFSDRITLRDETYKSDLSGYQVVDKRTDIVVWANVKSATRSEFYAADARKINVVIAFDVNSEDYKGQRKVVYNSIIYSVVRAYQKGLGTIELNCSDKAV